MCGTSGDIEPHLVERLRDGDIDAFEEIFNTCRRPLLAYIAALTGDHHLAEDVVQDTFVKLAQRRRRIRPEKGVRAWLYRVARNRAIDLMRRRGREVTGDTAPEDRGGARGPVEELARREREEKLRTSLASLPEKERDLLVLRFFGDLSFKEIARVVRRPLGTVLWQVHRSLAKLRGIVEKSHT
jgi:RNA polymerase sigma-70 factor (ECF subfamily)